MLTGTFARRGAPVGPAIRWWCTDRRGGVSAAPHDTLNLADHVGDDPCAVAANREALAREVGVAPADLIVMAAAHGRAVAHLLARDQGKSVGDQGLLAGAPEQSVGDQGLLAGRRAPETLQGIDVLVTADPGIALVAPGADCVPIALADPDAGVIAAVHAGWQGLRVDAVGAGIEAMVDLGADPTRMSAVLGPAICGGCYPVPQERADIVADVAPAAVTRSRDGQPALDIRAGLLARLVAAGVDTRIVGPCTAESPEHFSYRRDGRTGRQGIVVAMTA